jgi:pyruvate/2-oxoglutarate dehydrogenase complex dihydrolipoamide acyltransferase (E2) component
MRQTIAQRLKASQNAAASLTTFNEIDMSSIMDFRKLYKDGILKNEGVKLGFMSAFARASVLALKEIPAANASIEGDQIIYRDYVDLSVAVATPKGLVTPVVRNAEAMGLVDIEKAIAELGKKVSTFESRRVYTNGRHETTSSVSRTCLVVRLPFPTVVSLVRSTVLLCKCRYPRPSTV